VENEFFSHLQDTCKAVTVGIACPENPSWLEVPSAFRERESYTTNIF